jgi:phosphoribosylformylglycinamidine cyclo-ligase
VLGLASSGAHSNGYSLVRRIVERSGLGYAAAAPFATVSLGQALLEPTRIYVKPLLSAIRATGAVKGLAHITGGGLPGNVPRCLPDGTRAHLDARRWQAPPVFRWLREAGRVPTDDMLRTFNCGLGMIVVVAQKDAAVVAKTLTDAGESVHEIGFIEPTPNHEADCVIDHAESLWQS